MDIIALAEITIDKTNDYALACVLKSNNIFINPMSDEQIFAICNNRKQFVCENLSTEYVKFFTNIAQNKTNYIVNSFLEIVLKFVEKYGDSLEEFVKWFKTHNIQWQYEHIGQKGIKINTIHGSKGLESPVIVLLDFSFKAARSKMKLILEKDIFLVKPKKTDSFEELETIVDSYCEEEEKELLRLLYVAMTRAKERLYILGPFVKEGIFGMIEQVIQ
jgi:ATP-dependent exoDNAse (exonuclease V) beta subunit